MSEHTSHGQSVSRTYDLHIDLTGSNFPGAHFVDCVVDWPANKPLERLREAAAEHYAVPLEQVGPCRPKIAWVYCSHCHDGPFASGPCMNCGAAIETPDRGRSGA